MAKRFKNEDWDFKSYIMHPELTKFSELVGAIDAYPMHEPKTKHVTPGKYLTVNVELESFPESNHYYITPKFKIDEDTFYQNFLNSLTISRELKNGVYVIRGKDKSMIADYIIAVVELDVKPKFN